MYSLGKYIIAVFCLVLSSCQSANEKANEKINGNQKANDNFQIRPYYGFLMVTDSGNFFFKIENEHVERYISGDVNDTTVIKDLLVKTKYLYEIGGRSIEYYAWRNFMDSLDREKTLLTIDVATCSRTYRPKIIPVFLVSFNIPSSNVSKLDKCNSYLKGELLKSPKLSVIYIMPLDTKKMSRFQNLRDSISLESKGYKDFIRY